MEDKLLFFSCILPRRKENRKIRVLCDSVILAAEKADASVELWLPVEKA
jgi:hypothetical protein